MQNAKFIKNGGIMNKGLPMDFKIEHDRLVYQIEPLARRLAGILKELNCDKENIDFNSFTLNLSLTK